LLSGDVVDGDEVLVDLGDDRSALVVTAVHPAAQPV
jgi:hypothetical protein